MTFFKRFRIALGGIVLAFLLTGCAQSGIRQLPAFADATRPVERIAVLPPQVTHTLVGIRGAGSRHPALEPAIAEQVLQSVTSALEQRGYPVSTDLIVRIAQQDEVLAPAFDRLRAAYRADRDALDDAAMLSEETSSRFRDALGPAAGVLAKAGDADALVMVRFDGIEKSSGKVTTEVMASALLAAAIGYVSVPASDLGTIEVVLIDGRTGDILWRNIVEARGSASAAVIHVLNEFPTSPESLRMVQRLKAGPEASPAQGGAPDGPAAPSTP